MEDSEVLKKMFAAKNGNSFRDLYDGDITAYNMDDSAADMALCAHLAFWTNKNSAQMERIWLSSPIGNRVKTQERQDYRERTIQAAISRCGDVYKQPYKIQSESKKEKSPLFTPLSILFSEPEERVNWIVDWLLPASGFSVLVAKPKVGKSTLARQLALAVAQGEPFLGRNTEKGGVLYIALEEKRGEVRTHFRTMGAIGDENLNVYVDSAPENAQKWLEEAVIREQPALVIIDTLFRFARVSDLNDYSKTTAALDPILALSRSQSAHFMGVHHARKGGGEGGDATLGSTAIFGSVDTTIILKKTDRGRTIETQQRYGTDLESTMLLFDDVLRIDKIGDTKEESDIKQIKNAMIDLLLIEKTPIEEPTINEKVDGRTGLKRRALRELVTSGEITRGGTGKRGDPYLYSCSLVPTISEEQEKQELI